MSLVVNVVRFCCTILESQYQLMYVVSLRNRIHVEFSLKQVLSVRMRKILWTIQQIVSNLPPFITMSDFSNAKYYFWLLCESIFKWFVLLCMSYIHDLNQIEDFISLCNLQWTEKIVIDTNFGVNFRLFLINSWWCRVIMTVIYDSRVQVCLHPWGANMVGLGQVWASSVHISTLIRHISG